MSYVIRFIQTRLVRKSFLLGIANIIMFSIVLIYSIEHKENNLALFVVYFLLYTTIIFSALEINKKLNDINLKLSLSFDNIENLFSLFFTINPSAPLPKTGNWAASPDFLNFILKSVQLSKPRLVVELGSGTSTIVIGYELKKIQSGKLLSIEHNEKFYLETIDLIKLHHLEDYIELMYSPLVEVKIDNNMWTWYDLSQLDLKFDSIDMLIIDGPPEESFSLARFPALDFFDKYLSVNALIILDDGAREAEREIVQMWKRKFYNYVYSFLPLEKGAFLVKKL